MHGRTEQDGLYVVRIHKTFCASHMSPVLFDKLGGAYTSLQSNRMDQLRVSDGMLIKHLIERDVTSGLLVSMS